MNPRVRSPWRARTATAVFAAGALILTCNAADPRAAQPQAAIGLNSEGVALGPDGPRLVVSGASVALRSEQVRWLAAGTVPGPARYTDMARQALLDLNTLVLPGGAAVAGWSENWRYVWPRDASFVAAALARTGHADDALSILGFLARVQGADGTFQARYLPDGSGAAPDQRGIQLDGSGWVLWAMAEWYDVAPPGADRDAALLELLPMAVRALGAIDHHRDRETGLPDAGPDYWEVGESEVTLGTAAPLLLGARSAERLRSAAASSAVGGQVDVALHGAATLADHLDAAIERSFGAGGYPRYVGGADLDAAVTFLMPPFAPARDAVHTAWDRAAPTMARPAGGLAPGGGWRRDGVSWTPETALFALTAAATGDVAVARGWLDWLQQHRTSLGSLPEKVMADGQPASVAPLTWTAALVLLTLDELDRVEQTG